jgi:hypothetical protein
VRPVDEEEDEAALCNLTGSRYHPSPSPFSRCPCPGYSGCEDTQRLMSGGAPPLRPPGKACDLSLNPRSVSGSGRGPRPGARILCCNGAADMWPEPAAVRYGRGSRPPGRREKAAPFYRSRLYWSSVLCSPFWLVRCRTLPATVSSAVLAPILIGIKATCPRGRCVVCTRRASLRACCWLLLLLWFVPGLATSS